MENEWKSRMSAVAARPERGGGRRRPLFGGLLALLLALLSAAGMLVTTTKPAEAAYPGTNGKILFQSYGLYKVNPDGSVPTKIINYSTEGAAYSPDGKKIALNACGSAFAVCVMDADGNNLTQLSVPAGIEITSDSRLTWSPDGKRIAFNALEQDLNATGYYYYGGIFVIDANGDNFRRITGCIGSDAACSIGNRDQNPAWSPATTGAPEGRIAVESRSPYYSISVVNPDGTGRTKVAEYTSDGTPMKPSWSPDGRKLAYENERTQYGGGQIYLMDADGSNKTPLTSDTSTMKRRPVFSPDGKKIAFFRDREIFTMNADGSGQTRVVEKNQSPNLETLDWQAVQGPPDTTAPGPVSGLTAKPEDRQAFLSWTDPQDATYETTRILRSTTGPATSPEPNADQKQVYEGTAGKFTDPEDRFYYTSPLNNDTTYYYTAFAVDTSGNWSRAATTTVMPTPPKSATPLGSNGKIAYAADPNAAQNYDIYTANSDGTGQQKLAGTASNENVPVWSPDHTMIAFIRDGDSKGLYVMNADGTGEKKVADNPSYTKPSWSPDGKRLAFIRYLQGGEWSNGTVFVVNADGTGEKIIHGGVPSSNQGANHPTNGIDWSPAFPDAPDGKIAFGSPIHCDNSGTTFPCGSDISVMNADGTREIKSTNASPGTYYENPDWSPDGTSIAYEYRNSSSNPRDIGSMKADGSSQKNLTNTTGPDEEAPSWSPDGKKLAYEYRATLTARPDAYTMNADGSSQAKLIGAATGYEEDPSWGTTPDSAPADTTAPTVALTAPASGSTVSGSSVALKADATDDRAVTRVDFYVNGVLVSGDTTAGGTSGKEYSVSWDSKSVSDGPATITARAYDAAGHETISSSRSVTVKNTADPPPPPPPDTTPPTVSLTAPADGAIERGASVTLSAEATDNVGVTKVEFLVDGTVVGTDTTAGGTSGKEYSVTWDSTAITDGKSIVTARAYDSSNNANTSRGIVVDNTYPDTSIGSGPTEGSTTTSTSASFSFSSTERDSSFRCKLDSGAEEDCASPKSYSGLAVGAHTFQVYAVGAGGQADDSDLSPTIRNWTVSSGQTYYPPPHRKKKRHH